MGTGFWHIVDKAAKHAVENEIPLPAHVTWTANSFSAYMRQQIAVSLVNYSYSMRSLFNDSKWVPSKVVQVGKGNQDMAL